MKVLSTEQQAELQKTLEELLEHSAMPTTLYNQLRYWAIELKPKRVRKQKTQDLYYNQGEGIEFNPSLNNS